MDQVHVVLLPRVVLRIPVMERLQGEVEQRMALEDTIQARAATSGVGKEDNPGRGTVTHQTTIRVSTIAQRGFAGIRTSIPLDMSLFSNNRGLWQFGLRGITLAAPRRDPGCLY